MKKYSLIWIFVFLNFFIIMSFGQTLIRVSDFLVNNICGIGGAYQSLPHIIHSANGNYLVTWLDQRNGENDIYAQFYNSHGQKIGDNIIINDFEDNLEDFSTPRAVADSSGKYLIAWIATHNGKRRILGRFCSNIGNPIGQSIVLTGDSVNIVHPANFGIAPGASGQFILTWNEQRSWNLHEIYAQILDNNGLPNGQEFRVSNDSTQWWKTHPDIASDPLGNFVICWVNSGGFHNHSLIYAQKYDHLGNPVGGNFRVDQNKTKDYQDQYLPKIASSPQGEFIVVWSDERNTSYDPDLYAQRFAVDGSPIGTNFQVNENFVRSYPEYCSVTYDRSSNFAVAWMDKRFGENHTFAQFYDSTGQVLGGNVKLDSGVVENAGYPSISGFPSQNIIATWQDERNNDHNIYMQKFVNINTPDGNNIRINDDEFSSNQYYSDVIVFANGDYAVGWSDLRSGVNRIYVQQFNVDGVAIGNEIMVNDDSSHVYQYETQLAASANGNFVVVWNEKFNFERDICAKLFNRNGTPVTGKIIVNTDSVNANQYEPDVAMNAVGKFVVAWLDERGGYHKIHFQQFNPDGTRNGDNVKIFDLPGYYAEENPAIAINDSGAFVIIAEDGNYYYKIIGHRFNQNGEPVDSVFQVNDVNNYFLHSPVVCMDSCGRFITAWSDQRNDLNKIYAQRYDQFGAPIGSNFNVSDSINNRWKTSISVSINRKGNFFISWEDASTRNSDMYGQLYLADGSRYGDSFLLAANNYKNQNDGKTRLFGDKIYSSWTDNRQGGSGYDIWSNIREWQNPISHIEGNETIALNFKLLQNYPNPFNPITNIEYTLAKSIYVEIHIFDILGQRVKELVNTYQKTGKYNIIWNGTNDFNENISSGVYFCRIVAGEFVKTNKMVMLK